MRDNFTASTKKALANRVSHKCSNPMCRRDTSGPHHDPNRSISIGVAAHITAASVGGPRFDSSLNPKIRSSVDNGIWLCQSCAKLIDSDEIRFPVDLLKEWKLWAENEASASIIKPSFSTHGVKNYNRIPEHHQFSRLLHHDWHFTISKNLELDNRYFTHREFYLLLAYAFLAASKSSGLDSFNFILSFVLGKSNEFNSNSFPAGVALCSHVSSFITEFAELTDVVGTPQFFERTDCYPEDIKIEINSTFGAYMPYQVQRVGPKKVKFDFLDITLPVFRSPLKSSDLLIYISVMLQEKIVIIDDVDPLILPENERQFFKYTELLQKKQRKFCINDFIIDVNDPEKWDINLGGFQSIRT